MNYRVSIQTIAERLENAERIRAQMGGTIYLDAKREGLFPTFKNIIRQETKHQKHLVHFQDDVALAKDLESYIDTILQDMATKNMSLVSLFVPRRRAFAPENSFQRYEPLDNFLWCQGLVIRADFLAALVTYASDYRKQEAYDDVFVAHALRHYKTKAYVHIPALVQHRIDMKSSIGHANSTSRTSEVFDPFFVQRLRSANGSK